MNLHDSINYTTIHPDICRHEYLFAQAIYVKLSSDCLRNSKHHMEIHSDGYNAKEYKTHCIDCKIGKHMHKPGWVDGAAFFVEIVENQSACKQACQHQQEHTGRKPPGHHSHVVDGKTSGAEKVCKPSGSYPLQCEKGKAAEEKLFQQRIDKGYVQGYKYKIVFVHTDV